MLFRSCLTVPKVYGCTVWYTVYGRRIWKGVVLCCVCDNESLCISRGICMLLSRIVSGHLAPCEPSLCCHTFTCVNQWSIMQSCITYLIVYLHKLYCCIHYVSQVATAALHNSPALWLRMADCCIGVLQQPPSQAEAAAQASQLTALTGRVFCIACRLVWYWAVHA